MSNDHAQADTGGGGLRSAGGGGLRWVAVVPVKATAYAKTRLAPGIAGATPARIAAALATDTVTAVLACPLVEHVLVVTDDPDLAGPLAAIGALIVAESSPMPVTAPGFARLNAAVRQGAAEATSRWPGHGVIAMTGDLAALRPEDLSTALSSAGSRGRSFVADHTGTGTSALMAGPGVAVDPHFGSRSARAHAASGAMAITVPVESLRQDIDTLVDLDAGTALGLGPATSALLGLGCTTCGRP